jgi:hypothetical protein
MTCYQPFNNNCEFQGTGSYMVHMEMLKRHLRQFEMMIHLAGAKKLGLMSRCLELS